MRIFHGFSIFGIALVSSSRDVSKRRASDELSIMTTAPLADSVDATTGETDIGSPKRSRLWLSDTQADGVIEAAELLLSMANGNLVSRDAAFGRHIMDNLRDASAREFSLPDIPQRSELILHSPQTGAPASQPLQGVETGMMMNDHLVNHQTAPELVAGSVHLTIFNALAHELASKRRIGRNFIPSYTFRCEPTRAVAYVYPRNESHKTDNSPEYRMYMRRRVDTGLNVFQASIKRGNMDWSRNTHSTQKMLMYAGVLESFHNALLSGTANVEEYLVLQNLGHRIDDTEFARSIVCEWNKYCIEPLRLWEAGDRRAVPPCGPTEETISGERLFRLSKWQFEAFARRLMEISSLYIQRSEELKKGEPGSPHTYLDIHERRLVELLMHLPLGTLLYPSADAAAAASIA